jgi:alkanesulfonate monooxygenase
MMQALRIFTTCPPSVEASSTSAGPGPSYRSRIAEAARWSEAAGCEGILVYADNRLVDPWLASQTIIEVTERLSPLVAVQPAYMHPYSVAKMVATLGYLYGRKIYLNMVAGGFKRDLEALNDFTPHDDRYIRLEEYSRIIRDLALGSVQSRAVTFKGSYYSVEGLKLSPPVPPEIVPEFFVSGSSEAGMNTALALGAVAIQYPQPAKTYRAGTPRPDQRRGVRVGIIARESAELAWQEADERFPPDRRGQIAHQLAMKTSDSSWHKDLSERPAAGDDPESPYWLRPFHSYQTFCPYLVGSYARVSAEIAAYAGAGFGTFILDVPASAPELASIRTVFETVRDQLG